jgi:hypothetical protein
MNPKLIAIAVAVILTVAVLAWLYVQRRRRSTTAEMRQRFGPEYERAVGEQGSERRAEAQLRLVRSGLRACGRESRNLPRSDEIEKADTQTRGVQR